jgi:hypothetical protein
VLCALPISSSLTWSPCQYLVRRTSYKVPHYAVLSNLTPPPQSDLSSVRETKLHTHTKQLQSLSECNPRTPI